MWKCNKTYESIWRGNNQHHEYYGKHGKNQKLVGIEFQRQQNSMNEQAERLKRLVDVIMEKSNLINDSAPDESFENNEEEGYVNMNASPDLNLELNNKIAFFF